MPRHLQVLVLRFGACKSKMMRNVLGYTGNQESSLTFPSRVSGLEKRGYDSASISCLNQAN